MGRSRSATRINLLTAKQVLSARDGDFTDGGGLLLRTAGAHASWVFRSSRREAPRDGARYRGAQQHGRGR